MLIDALPRILLRIPTFERLWMRSWFRVPPPESAQNGVGDFFAVGKEFVDHFQTYAELKPDARVLDVGCGSGRIALGLAPFLNARGSYEGFDIRPEPVAWCTRQITPRFPRFRFQAVDVLNHAYAPQGGKPASEFTFPYPDASFDFAVLTSVFTHMRPDDVRRYLAELHRVLRPGAVTFVTWFVLNDETRKKTAEHRSTLGFHWQHGECWAADEKSVEVATGYEEEWILSAYSRAGFRLNREILHGWWFGRPRDTCISYQDYIIASRVE